MSAPPDALAFLRSAAFQDAARGSASRPPSPFVTISRQRGAGASAAAQALLARLPEWRIYDRSLCEEVAADPRLSVFFDSLLQENYRAGMADLMAQFLANDAPQAAVTRRMLQAMRAAAVIGKAVIVGRAGSLATRHLPLGVHVRLVGSPDVRLARLITRGFSKTDAERELRVADAARARLARSWFRKDIDDPLLYDAVLNTDHLSPGDVAEVIASLIKARQAAPLPVRL